jgi:DNA-binding NarL/FixJ family response regulator
MFIDISMPGMNGLAVTSLIKGREAAPKIVVMTLEDSEEHRSGAIAAGADAFLPKDNFAHGFHTVLESLFATSSVHMESQA